MRNEGYPSRLELIDSRSGSIRRRRYISKTIDATTYAAHFIRFVSCLLIEGGSYYEGIGDLLFADRKYQEDG
jgi:hypothetical protein